MKLGQILLDDDAPTRGRDVRVGGENIDVAIAKEKLGAMGIHIDRLTREQKKYLASWNMGT